MRILTVFLLVALVGCGKSVPTQTLVLQHGPVTILAGQYYHWAVDAEANKNNRLKASIQVTQGGSLDVAVFVVSELEMTNYINGNDFRSIYNSGRVTVAEVNVTLSPPGRYYLIVSNRFSTFTSKTVSISATLE